MKLRPSITLRLIAHLIPAQILALVTGWAVFTGLSISGLWPGSMKLSDLAADRTQNLLIESLRRGEDGELRIEPTAALLDEMKRVPALKLAAYDPSRKMIAHGSAAELTPVLYDRPATDLIVEYYFLTDDSKRGAMGSVSSTDTAVGQLRIAIYGQRFRWDDPLLALRSHFMFYWPYVLCGILLCSGGSWLAVRRGLVPLRKIAADAAQVDVDKLDQRLLEGAAPVEILPLVGAFNDTLTRLDMGVGRLRRFIANAAHELRTPVAILEARLDHFDLPTIRNDLRRDVRRIRVIIEQLLATTRMARNDRAKTATVDLVEICRAVVDDFALLAIRQHRAVEFQPEADRLETRGDAGAFQSVIANLVDNALRAEPQRGMVMVRVSSKGVIEVVDHGPGIAEQEREMIFEPFWRKSMLTEGAGLGLAIAKELTEALGGRIWVEETPGGGATFKLLFQTAANDAALDGQFRTPLRLRNGRQ